MKKYDIEQIPVFKNDQPIGSVSENGLFNKLFSNPNLKEQPISEIMEKPLPLVPFDTPVERLSTLITREQGALLSKDEAGNFHILTKYDLLQSLAR